MTTPSIFTQAVHAGVHTDPATGAVMTPIYQTSTFAQSAPGEHQGWDYSRAGNPTRDALETSLAALENAQHGLAFSSGLAAIQAVIQTLEPNSHVLVCDDVYGGTGRLFRTLMAPMGFTFDFVDMTSIDGLASQFKPNTRLVWIESPTNPLMKLIDIQALATLTHKKGAKLAVDNTFASPVFQQPLALGADVVMHSTTKYIGGHSDLVGGALMINDDQWFEQLKYVQFALGAVTGPMESWLLLRSIKTLAIRMERHQENALTLAQWLSTHDGIEAVYYPGLETSPDHALANQQMSGYSGMISFRIKGDYSNVTAFLKALDMIVLAESLGGVETLINHPEKMTHASVPPELREKLGITENLLRLSVGIENVEDIRKDLEKALAAIQ